MADRVAEADKVIKVIKVTKVIETVLIKQISTHGFYMYVFI